MNEPVLSLVVETPQGTMLRRISAPTPLLNEQRRGIEAEEASRRAAARRGLPDFIFSLLQRPSGRGVREIGDGILIVGGRAAVLQVKSREAATDEDSRERSWLDKNIAKGLRQAQGTIRGLRRQPATMINSRGREVEIDGTDYEWLSVVIIDHDHIPDSFMPTLTDAGHEVVLARRDWEFLYDQLRSTHAVLDYLNRAAGERIALGHELIRYYEFAQADLTAQPAPLPEWFTADGAIRSVSRAPMEPAGVDDTRAHELLRIILEDIADTPLDRRERKTAFWC